MDQPHFLHLSHTQHAPACSAGDVCCAAPARGRHILVGVEPHLIKMSLSCALLRSAVPFPKNSSSPLPK